MLFNIEKTGAVIHFGINCFLGLLFLISPQIVQASTINEDLPGKDSTIVQSSDTTAARKVPWHQLIYSRVTPLIIYTGQGYLKDRISQNIEVGYSLGMVDAGLSVGRTSLRQDSAGGNNAFLEAKITMDISQYGIFSNEMTVGAGYIFNPQTPLLLELSYTIFAQFWKKGGIGIITGFYDFSGDHADNFHNMFGVYFRYGILRAENGGILNIGRIMHAHRLRMGRH